MEREREGADAGTVMGAGCTSCTTEGNCETAGAADMGTYPPWTWAMAFVCMANAGERCTPPCIINCC